MSDCSLSLFGLSSTRRRVYDATREDSQRGQSQRQSSSDTVQESERARERESAISNAKMTIAFGRSDIFPQASAYNAIIIRSVRSLLKQRSRLFCAQKPSRRCTTVDCCVYCAILCIIGYNRTVKICIARHWHYARYAKKKCELIEEEKLHKCNASQGKARQAKA